MKNPRLLLVALFATPLFLSACTPSWVSDSAQTQSGSENSITGSVISQSGFSSDIEKPKEFSKPHIAEILAKIESNSLVLQNEFRQATGSIQQGDFNAKYSLPADYSKQTDRITTDVSSIKSTFPGVYGERERTAYMDAIQKWECQLSAGGTGTMINGKPYRLPTDANCLMQNRFGGFLGFSPSGYYLLYATAGWEYTGAVLVDAKTGKEMLRFSYPSFYGWTPDRGQFVFAGGSEMGASEGLRITVRDAFPETQILSSDYVVGAYMDETRLYARTYHYELNRKVESIRIFDLSTLNEVFTEVLNIPLGNADGVSEPKRTFTKQTIPVAKAIAQCNQDMAQPVFYQCRNEKDVASITAFAKLLQLEWDNAQKVHGMVAGENSAEGGYGANYLGYHSHTFLKTKYFEGGYLFLLRSPQYEGTDNVIFEYRKINTSHQGVDVSYDDLSAWTGVGGEPIPNGYYEKIATEFENGHRFSNPNIQKFYDSFMENIRNR